MFERIKISVFQPGGRYPEPMIGRYMNSVRFQLQQGMSGFAQRLPLLSLVLVLLVAGCKSTGTPKSSRLASVIIKGHSQVQVAQMTQQVFIENEYERALLKTADLVFEKQGTTMNNLVYGDWSGKGVWVRVKVYLRELGDPHDIMLDCNTYMVQEHNNPLFEEEHKLTKMRKGPYQKLLNEVSKRLKESPQR